MYDEEISIDPKFAQAYNNKGLSIAVNLKQYDKALMIFNKSIKLYTTFTQAMTIKADR